MSSSTRVAPGLPTNPRARLAGRTAPPSRQAESSRPSRAQVAIPATPRPNRNPPQRAPVPDTSSRAYRPQQRNDYDGLRDVRRSADSDSTSSSSDAASWPRVVFSSSRTTLQSDDGTQGSNQAYESHREKTGANHSYYDSFTWSRVTEAATMITQEVSKAWTAGLAPHDNEDNNEGESHLTRVMRAYHLSKARTPSELPAWLFSERERGQGGLLRFDKLNSHDDGSQVRAQPPQHAQRRNRPAYGDSTTTLGIQGQRNKDIQSTKPFSSSTQANVSGSDRLKQMRELRRNAPGIAV